LIAELLEWARGSDGDSELADAKCDPGGGDIVTAAHFQPAGIDSHPLPKGEVHAGDYVLLVPGPEVGSYVVAGYLDPTNAGVARPGDIRLYARDDDGFTKAELHLTYDGEEPDWQATAGALIARADRTEATLQDLADAYNVHKHSYNDSKGTAATATPSVTDVPSSVAAPPGSADPDFQYTPGNVGADKGYVT
jgi:hypothetical protein